MNALKAGKHVFIEKPGARTAKDLMVIVDFKRLKGQRAGYNHRFHHGIHKALDIVKSGCIDEIYASLDR